MSAALAAAEAAIIANCADHAQLTRSIAADHWYSQAIAIALASRIEFHEDDYGWGGFDRIANYHSSSKPYRRRRATLLAHVRRAKLFNGYRCLGQYVHEIRRCRAMERLIASQQQMQREHAAGRVGNTMIASVDGERLDEVAA